MAKTIADPAQAAPELAERFSRARRAVFFGGAGVSTASGIPDFRSADGLYHQHFAYPPEEMLSHDFFVSHTDEFYDFYRERMVCLDARPNQAHRKLAELEREGHLAAVVTQNIDGLHQAVGSRVVHELHGSTHRNVCTREADLLVIGGTSLVVYPAAGLVNYFQGEDLVIVNRNRTPQDDVADLVCACDIAAAFDF